jgi:hypothetical protein
MDLNEKITLLEDSYKSNKVINKKYQNHEKYIFDNHISDYNNKIYFNKDNDEIFHVINGTNPFGVVDLITDSILAVGGETLLKNTNRFRNSKSVFESVEKKYGKKPSLISHSLGGSVSNILSKQKKVNSFQVNRGVGLGDIGSKRNKYAKEIRTSGDIVSKLSDLQYGKENRTTIKNNNILTNHFFEFL